MFSKYYKKKLGINKVVIIFALPITGNSSAKRL
jgi:hypothetical protein